MTARALSTIRCITFSLSPRLDSWLIKQNRTKKTNWFGEFFLQENLNLDDSRDSTKSRWEIYCGIRKRKTQRPLPSLPRIQIKKETINWGESDLIRRHVGDYCRPEEERDQMGARGDVLLDSVGCDTLRHAGKRSISLHNPHLKKQWFFFFLTTQRSNDY